MRTAPWVDRTASRVRQDRRDWRLVMAKERAKQQEARKFGLNKRHQSKAEHVEKQREEATK